VTDYATELLPPEYRNLVANPSGEASIGATWLASNGTVFTGSAAVAPLSGAGVVEYEVTTQSSLGYHFAPMGPRDGTVHHGGFKIPEGRQVSARLQVRSDGPVWVRVHASWQNMLWNSNGQPSGLYESSSSVAGPAVQVDELGWTELEVTVPAASVPPGPSHWRPLVTVYSTNPDTTDGDAPAVGTVVWADQAFVPDSGADLTGVAYADGDSAGWEWEGEPHYSSSRTASGAVADPDVGTPPAELDLVDEVDATQVPEAPIEAVSEEVPPPPVIPDAGDDDPARLWAARTNGRGPVTLAEDQIAWRSRNRHLCLNGDVQLGGLVMNEMDEQGVVWIVNEIEGWWTTPEPDVPDVPRGFFDGSYETRGRYGARTFTVTGTFVPRSPRDVAQARDRLIRAANLCHRGDWFMTHEDPSPARTDSKGSKVWLAGQPLINTAGLNGKTDFSLALRAPDPVKYGIKEGVPPGYETMRLITSNSVMPEREYPRQYPWAYPEAVFGNSVGIIENRGNAVVWPVLKMSGPTNGAVSVYNVDTGQRFRITKKLYPGETLVVDCATKQVTLNGEGNYRFYLDVDVDWLMLQPGPNKIYFAEEILGGIRTELEVQWRSGWIG
jgi:hypothetical protein